MLARIIIFIFVVDIFILSDAATEPANFRWTAYLNRESGIANSREESSATFHRASRNRSITATAHQIIEDYPKFLTRPSLTLGMLTTKNLSGKKTDLCTSIGSLGLLSFGSLTATPKKVCNKLAKLYSGTVICSDEIPILGGLLAQSSIRDFKNRSGDEGRLRFTLIRKIDSTTSNLLKTILVTEIVGPYKPSIAGKSYPRSKFRSQMYYATQRMFHEYVMWRFHRQFMRELERNLNCLD